MKRLILFCAVIITALFIQACSQDDLVGVPQPDPNALQAIVTINSDIIPNGGRIVIPPNIQAVFDGSRSTGTITRRLWSFYRANQLFYTDTNNTFTKMFTVTPDSFLVVYKVWGILNSDTSSVSFTVVVGQGSQGSGDFFIESSTIGNNGKRATIYRLPIWFLPVGPYNRPTVYGYHGAPYGNGKEIPLDTINGTYRFRDTSYENGGDKFNFSGTPAGAWGDKTKSVNYQYPFNENLYWLDVRGGLLRGWGQPALTPPPGVGDTSYLNGVFRLLFSQTQITMRMNVRTGNFPWSHTPQYQYALGNGNYSSLTNMTMPDATGYGQAVLLMSTIGNETVVKVKIPGVNITGSMFYSSADDALVFVVIQPLRTFLTLQDARSQGYLK